MQEKTKSSGYSTTNIQGTVQISIQQFDELREKAEEAEKYRKQLKSMNETLSELVESLDDTEYKKRIAIIDADKDLEGEALTQACAEAAATLKVRVSEQALRELILAHIDDTESEGHYDIKHMKKQEFAKIPLILGKKSRR